VETKVRLICVFWVLLPIEKEWAFQYPKSLAVVEKGIYSVPKVIIAYNA
jgi:hypothetical protein